MLVSFAQQLDSLRTLFILSVCVIEFHESKIALC
jgi:hypothetical protein